MLKKNYLYKQQLTVGDTLLSSHVIFSQTDINARGTLTKDKKY